MKKFIVSVIMMMVTLFFIVSTSEAKSNWSEAFSYDEVVEFYEEAKEDDEIDMEALREFYAREITPEVYEEKTTKFSKFRRWPWNELVREHGKENGEFIVFPKLPNWVAGEYAGMDGRSRFALLIEQMPKEMVAKIESRRIVPGEDRFDNPHYWSMLSEHLTTNYYGKGMVQITPMVVEENRVVFDISRCALVSAIKYDGKVIAIFSHCNGKEVLIVRLNEDDNEIFSYKDDEEKAAVEVDDQPEN